MKPLRQNLTNNKKMQKNYDKIDKKQALRRRAPHT